MATCSVVGLLAGAARSATTTFNRNRTIQFDGRSTFPIVLSPGPPPNSTTPWGTNGLAETTSAGVNVFRTGVGGAWSAADIKTALDWDRAAAALHAYTWPNLGGYSLAQPGSPEDAGLANVVNTLTDDPSGSAIAFWKGRDEPWWGDFLPSQLQFAYCRVTSRGDPSWCDNEVPLDPSQLWVTIEAPKGSAAELAPYSSVTDVHGVDIYPVTLAQPFPNLHRVGTWTASLASVTPLGPVWTTLQICSSGSFDKTTGQFIVPTFQQERYMAYDAILNGAKALTFFGGNNANCFTGNDSQYGWNWSFWQSVLKPLVQQLGASSQLAPALVNGARTPRVTTGGSGTEVSLRQGTSVDDLWLIAARTGAGSATVTFRGLPSWAHRGAVYTENRTITAAGGTLRDRFNQWDVHVYHFVEPLILKKLSPRRARVGSRVTLRGKGLAAATAVSLGDAKARFKIVADNKLVVTVPPHARTGPVVVTSPLKQVQSTSELAIVPTAKTKPRIEGVARLGHRLSGTNGVWYGDEPSRYTFRWLACNIHGNACKPVPGASKQTLKLGPTRLGKRYRFLVTAHTTAGTGSAVSAATTVVTR
ncbi:MAG TPA: IPT/TIG domain-containing protein [Gaiellaceae bacterium]|nr:IPT/TIG domain-containing protein [Gaiellaceae bacterium]